MRLPQNKEDLEDTKKILEEDEAFLAEGEMLFTTDAEWEERTKTRQLEMEKMKVFF